MDNWLPYCRNKAEKKMKLGCFMLVVVAALWSITSVAQCTPATVNPGSVMQVRPHMTPAAVSGVLGCAPTDIPISLIGVWVWGIPLVNPLGIRMQLAVVFDAEGALSAQYQLFPPITPPTGNGALRVEPPSFPIGNWVPGVMP